MQKHKAKMSLLIQPIVRALLLPALLFSYELAYAELNLPPSTTSITAQIKESHPGQFNKKSTANPTGTDKKPLIVENFEAESTRERLEQERPYEEEKATNERLLIKWTIILGVATCLLVFVGIGQIFMFWKQLGLMRKTVGDGTIAANAAQKSADAAKINAVNSEKTVAMMQSVANTQLRAFVFPVNIFSFWEEIPETILYGWRFCPQWQNSGATPTKNLTIHAWGELREKKLPKSFDFNYATNNIGNGLIPPRLTLMGGRVPQGTPAISPEDILDIQSGKKLFYMFGWAKYNDVFPGTPQHITRFCWSLTATGDPLTFKPGAINPTEQLTFGYLYHSSGNCADEECEHNFS